MKNERCRYREVAQSEGLTVIWNDCCFQETENIFILCSTLFLLEGCLGFHQNIPHWYRAQKKKKKEKKNQACPLDKSSDLNVCLPWAVSCFSQFSFLNFLQFSRQITCLHPYPWASENESYLLGRKIWYLSLC